MKLIKLTSKNAAEAIKALAAAINGGGIAILPFDTVYGFAARADDDRAIELIQKLKGRESGKPLGVAVQNLAEAKKMADFSTAAETFIKKRLPGRYTFILPAKKNLKISKHCLSNGKIGIRVPKSGLILKLIETTGAIAQTSANKAGRPDCRKKEDIFCQFSSLELDLVEIIVDGGAVAFGPSKIYSFENETVREIERN